MSILTLVIRDAPSPSQDPTSRRFVAQALAGDGGSKSGSLSKYLESLAVHIPAEVMGIYVFGLSVIGTISQEFPWANNTFLYILCVVLTPVFALITARIRDGSSSLSNVRFVAWIIIAPTIAFVFWGLAIPENPFVTTEAAHLLVGFLAVVVSALLDSLKKVVYPAT